MRESAVQAVQLSSQSRLGDHLRREGTRKGALDAAQAGADPIDHVVMMEDHDGAYYAWKQAGISGRVLLHIDAHIDWNWIADKDPRDLLQAQSLTQVESMIEEQGLWNFSGRRSEELVHIGNYIYPALKEGIVREFVWIVPDSFMETPAGWKNLVRQFRNLQRINPRAMKGVTIDVNRVVAVINNTKVTACTLSHLREIGEPVLLDIDTDFLMLEPDESARAGDDLWKQLPWIWPDELVARLKDKGVRTDFVTISYSVEGGFTPLTYKYLGDELMLRLKHPELPEGHRELLAHKRRGASYRHDNELDRAIAEYEIAIVLEPEDASSHFNLAYLYDKKGASDQAAARYHKAVQFDSTYATAYNNFGLAYQSLGMLNQARDEYQRLLRWDPQNANAHYGLAEILAAQRHWDEAMRQYRTVLEITPDHAGALRGLGFVHLKRKHWDEAVTQFLRAVTLQPQDGFGFFWLGAAYSHQHRWDEAIEAYRTALRCGLRTIAIHRRLGGLYLRKRKLYKALKHYRNALRVWGGHTLFSIRERSRMLFEQLSRER
jgi:tetratricopeptide (TPR) repeat protein